MRGTKGLHALETELVSWVLRHRLECAGQILLAPVNLPGAGGLLGWMLALLSRVQSPGLSLAPLPHPPGVVVMCVTACGDQTLSLD